MATWFYAPNFLFSTTSFYFDPRNVPAYYATFATPQWPGHVVSLCVLHDEDLAEFPYPFKLIDAISVLYASKNGLELVGSASYGFVSRGDTWIPYRWQRPQWDRFTRRAFWNWSNPEDVVAEIV